MNNDNAQTKAKPYSAETCAVSNMFDPLRGIACELTQFNIQLAQVIKILESTSKQHAVKK